ncbi:hypothetical protein MTO96_023783 [Rhipicephalus appendiculatus]
MHSLAQDCGIECQLGCAVEWCPAIKEPGLNQYIDVDAADPDLLPEDAEEIEEIPKEGAAEIPENEETTPRQSEESQTENSEEKAHVPNRHWAVKSSPDCKDSGGSTAAMNGKGCMLNPRNRRDHVDGTPCVLGVCRNGWCIYEGVSICSSS